MTVVNSRTRAAVALAAIFSMLVHSGGETASLVGIAAGGVLLLLGIWAMSRAAAVGGLLITVGITTYFTQIDTMADAREIVFASVALFVPALALGWAALTAEAEQEYRLSLRTRQFLVASLFGTVCMVSVPAAMVLSRLLFPSASVESSVMLEIAVILTAASVPSVYFFVQEPRAAEEGPEAPEPE